MEPDELDKYDALVEESLSTHGVAASFGLLDTFAGSSATRVGIFADLMRANLFVQVGRLDEAARLLNRVMPTVEESDLRLLAHGQAVLGITALSFGLHMEASSGLRSAFDLFSALELWWKVGAVEINLAQNDLFVGDHEGALARLAQAEAQTERTPVPDHWKEVRRGIIDFVRSSVLQISGESLRAAQLLVIARRRFETAGAGQWLARADAGLADLYPNMGMYGSALEAALSAVDGFLAEGMVRDARLSQISVCKALVPLGRLAEVEEILSELVSAGEKESSKERWRLSALRDLEALYRRTDRSEAARATAGIRRSLTDTLDGLVLPEYIALLEIEDLYDQVMGAAMSNEKSAPIDAGFASALESLRRSQSPVARAIADLLDDFFGVYSGRALTSKAERQIHELTAAVGSSGAAVIAGLRLALASRFGGYEDAFVRSALIALYHEQNTIRSLEDEAFRSQALTLGSSREVTTALAAAAMSKDPCLMAEVIEFCRSAAFASLSEPRTSELPTYRELTRGLEPARLATPIQVGVNGRSRMGEARESGRFVDLATLREQWGGEGAGWLSLIFHREVVHWSFLSDDVSAHGHKLLTQSFWTSMDAVLRSHAVVLEADAGVVGAEAPAWLGATVALARASVGALVDRPDVTELCLAALPNRLRGDAAQYALQAAPRELTGALEVLGEYLIPEVVREWLTRDSIRRLLVSVPAQAATIPWPLLPVGTSGRELIEVAALQIAPPVELAQFMQPPAAAPRPLLLDLTDPTDDLAHARAHRDSANRLHGWARAHSMAEVATAQNVLSQLSALHTRSGAASFIGHVRPGTPTNPSYAALRLASAEAGGMPSYLSAQDLIRRAPFVPSHVYLGGCEGSGLGTGLEWASIPAALLVRGASCVISHAWPLIDDEMAALVDSSCVDALVAATDPVDAVWRAQIGWYRAWRAGGSAPAPHWWAGIHVISRRHEPARPMERGEDPSRPTRDPDP